MKQEKNGSEKVFNRPATRRQVIKAGGIAALGFAFSKPLIETLRPAIAFASGGNIVATPALETIIIEAEDMVLDGYHVELGNRIRLLGSSHGPRPIPYDPPDPSLETGTATALFPGPTGNYRIDVEVLAENDGRPLLELWVAGALEQTWEFPLAPTSTFVPTILAGPTLHLNNGVEVILFGVHHSGAWARVDRVTFTPT